MTRSTTRYRGAAVSLGVILLAAAGASSSGGRTAEGRVKQTAEDEHEVVGQKPATLGGPIKGKKGVALRTIMAVRATWITCDVGCCSTSP